MKRIHLGVISLFGVLALPVSADTLVGPGGAFQPWTASVLGPSSNPTLGGPYWNNFSGDGLAANIGWCMLGTGGCAIASPPGAIAFYGNGLKSVPNMNFVNSGVPVTVSLLGSFTNQKGGTNGIDYFGWYAINPDGTIGAMTQLWNSTAPVNATSAVITPSGNYGFYLENVQGNGAADYFWFMNSTQDRVAGNFQNPNDTLQHFAVFSGNPGDFYIGVEESNFGDGDFNDLIVKVSTAPEPGTYALIGCAVIALSLRKRVSSAA